MMVLVLLSFAVLLVVAVAVMMVTFVPVTVTRMSVFGTRKGSWSMSSGTRAFATSLTTHSN